MPRSDRRLVRIIPVLFLLALTACTFETEGRSGEAQATLMRYLEGLAGGADDRGWSVLSESTREGYGTRQEYLELARLSGEGGLPIVAMQVAVEDDGFYQFAVTTSEPIDEAYAELLFRAHVDESTIACATGPGEFEMAVIIAPFSEFNGVTANSCPAASAQRP